MSLSSAYPRCSSGAKKGNDWMYNIYFAPEADNSCGELYEMKIKKLKQLLNTKQKSSRWFKCCKIRNCFRSETDQRGRHLKYETDEDDMSSGPLGEEDKRLIKKLKELLNVEEIIEDIRACKHELWKWLPSDVVFYHMFILFKTKYWWWSIEKNTEGITIQRSRQMEYVKCRYRQKDRPSVTEIEYDIGKRSMMDLINWLDQENELNKEYNYLSSNCIHFATAVFNHVAKSKGVSTWPF